MLVKKRFLSSTDTETPGVTEVGSFSGSTAVHLRQEGQFGFASWFVQQQEDGDAAKLKTSARSKMNKKHS